MIFIRKMVKSFHSDGKESYRYEFITKEKYMKIALVGTQGGHLTEIIQVLDAFEGHNIFFATQHSIRDEDIKSIAPAYFSPIVGKRYHVFIWIFIWSLWLLIRERPQVVFSTGAEIALPFIFWAKVLGIRTLFLESWCRVNQLSRTGEIALRLVDEFWVQWPQLVSVYGSKVKYLGAVL